MQVTVVKKKRGKVARLSLFQAAETSSIQVKILNEHKGDLFRYVAGRHMTPSLDAGSKACVPDRQHLGHPPLPHESPHGDHRERPGVPLQGDLDDSICVSMASRGLIQGDAGLGSASPEGASVP